MSSIWQWVKAHRRSILLAGFVTFVSSAVLLVHLGSLPGGTSSAEAAFQARYASLSTIIHDPVQLPLLLMHWFVGLWAPENAFWLRVPSVLFAGLSLAATAYVLRRWYGPRTAVFGYALFLCAAWLLHVGRLGTVDILYFWALPTLCVGQLLLHNHPGSRLVTLLWLTIQITLLYVPGGIWLVLLGAYLQRKEISQSLAGFGSLLGKLGAAIFAVLLVSPLVAGLVIGNTREVGLSLLGLPTALPGFSTVARNLGETLLFIGFRGTADSANWLNHLPILDIFLSITFLTGLYFYAKHWRASRAKLLSGALLIGVVLASISGPVTIGLLVPALLFVVAAGVAYLLHLWLAVFPRNPIARGLGIGLMSLAVGVSCLYGLRQYFVAWPRHNATAPAFSEHKITRSHL